MGQLHDWFQVRARTSKHNNSRLPYNRARPPYIGMESDGDKQDALTLKMWKMFYEETSDSDFDSVVEWLFRKYGYENAEYLNSYSDWREVQTNSWDKYTLRKKAYWTDRWVDNWNPNPEQRQNGLRTKKNHLYVFWRKLFLISKLKRNHFWVWGS